MKKQTLRKLSRTITLVCVAGGLTVATSPAKTAAPMAAGYKVNVFSHILYKNPHNGEKLYIGGFSGLFPVPGGPPGAVYVVSDRGPGPDFVDVSTDPATSYKLFPVPDFGPTLMTLQMVPGGVTQILDVKPLTKPDGSLVTGLPVTKPATADLYDLDLQLVPRDVDGIDTEGLTMDAAGNFWVCEEYKPSIAMVSPEGVVQMRLVPKGMLTGDEVIPTYDILPKVLSKRIDNRGMEGIAATANGRVYAIVQRPLANPSKLISNGGLDKLGNTIPPSCNLRLVEVNLQALAAGQTATAVRQLIYVVDTANSGTYASDLFAISDSVLLVPERKTDKLYAMNLASATDVTPLEDADGKLLADPSKTIEMLDAAGLATFGITPVKKAVVLDSLTAIDPQLAKCEGVCVIGDWVVLAHDNDFNLDASTLAAPPPQQSKGPLLEINLQNPPNLPRLFVVPFVPPVFNP